MEDILPPSASSPPDAALASTDADLYKQALAHVGKEGEADLKVRIIQRSKESTMSLMSKAGVSDHARVKAMSLVHEELTAYVCGSRSLVFRCS